MSMATCQYGTPRFRSLVLYWPAQVHTWSYILRCKPLSQGSRITVRGCSRRREKKSQDMALLMFSASARFSSSRGRTGSRRPFRSSSASGVEPAGPETRSVMWNIAPQAAPFQQLRGQLVLERFRLAGGLVFQTHGLLNGGDLQARKFSRAVSHHGCQPPPRYDQIDEVASEGIGSRA